MINFRIILISLIAVLSCQSTLAQDDVSFQSQLCLSKLKFLDTCTPLNVTGKLYKASSDILIIVTHNSQGTDERHYRYAEHIRKLGFSALVIDHWKSRGVWDAQKNFVEVGMKGGNSHNMVIDVNWAMIHFKAKGFTKFGFIGESMGGNVGMLLNKKEWQSHFNRVSGMAPVQMSAIAVLYGNCNERYSYDVYLKIPMLMITGELDENTPSLTCKKYVNEWANPRGSNITFIELPKQYHDFDASFRAYRSPSAENPANCVSTVDPEKITSSSNGRTYPNTPSGWNEWKRDCILKPSQTTAMYGNTGDPYTGFKEWSEFFQEKLSR